MQGNMLRKWISSGVFLLLPVVFLIIGLNFNRTRYSNDPEYAYLMNGLNIARGKFVGHAENPGTTVQIIGAAVIRAKYLFSPTEGKSLQQHVLLHPDEYIESIHRFLVVLNALFLLLPGLAALYYTRHIWPGLLLQLGVFLSANLLEHAWTKVSPEPVLVMATAAMAIALLAYYSAGNKAGRPWPAIFAVITAFGLVTKATFLPVLIIPLLLLQNRKERFTYLKWLLLASIVLTIPALPEYLHLAKWFLLLFIHTGTYGQGGVGILDPGHYFHDLIRIAEVNPALVFSSLFILVISSLLKFLPAFKARYSAIPAVQYAFAVSLAQLAAILMVAKHYHGNHYLVPVQGLTAVSWIFILLAMKEIAVKSKVIHYVLQYLLIAAFLGLALLNRPALALANEGYRISNDEYKAVMKKIQTEYPGYLKTWYYPTSINPYSALRWGNVYSRGYNLQTLDRLYPDGVFYDTRSNSFLQWETPLNAARLLRSCDGKILLIGGPLSPAELDLVKQGGLSLIPVYLGRAQAIFRADVSNSKIFR